MISQQPITEISDRERQVLTVLAEHYDPWEGACIYMRLIAKETQLEIPQVRRAVRALTRKGLAEYHRGLFDQDGMLAGSGYCASQTGKDLIDSQLLADEQAESAEAAKIPLPL